MEPLFNDTPFVVFYAPSKHLYDETVHFYTEVLDFDVIPVDSPPPCETTIDTCWLSSCPSSPGDSATIQLLLDASKAATADQIEAATANLLSHKQKRDWRTLQSAVCFQTRQLPALISRLQAEGSEYQVRPSDLDPFEVYVVDPLGSLVGFSALKNAFGVASRTRFDSSYAASPSGLTTVASTSAATPLAKSLASGMTQRRRNIAVMTSGGDAPGMNANVRAIIRAAIYKGCHAFAIFEGYSGLVKGGPEYIKEMKWHNVRGWLSEGGTNIGTARCMEFKERWGRLAACKHLIEAGIDALIVCGGDGSLTGADLFRSEWPSLIEELLGKKEITQHQFDTYKHLNICGTVGSIDNDMSSTDATIGAYSSLARICEAIDYIGATAKSHQRAFVVEVMGRHCGWLALMAGIATAADYIFIPEKPSSRAEWSDHMCEIVKKHRARGKRNTIVIVAEGAIDINLNHISPEDVKDVLVKSLKLDTRITTLGHVQRGGPAVAYDRNLATLQGVAAVEAVLDGTPDTPSPMIAVAENKIVRRPLVEAVKLTKSVARAISQKNFAQAISLRDSEFNEHLKNFMAMNAADFGEPSLPPQKRKRFAIINVGAPAGGMNSAVYAFATYCMSRGHIPYAIHNGFPGLARHEGVRSLDWLDIDGWMCLGGSELGTNRTTPEDTDIGMVAYYFDKYHFDGLVMVGGFEAFESLSQLERARANYTAFRIPMVLIPATISNNVPGTQYSLGSDTCLNSLVEYCDSIKQSAAATRNRCFVVETMGGNCGYIASFAQLTTGAVASYVPEEGMSLEQFEQDIETLKVSFDNDKGKEKSGRLLVKSINASSVFSSDVMAEIINSEAHRRFDAKTAVPGHVQQGGIPSPIDRSRGARFAIRAIQYLEDHFDDIAPLQEGMGEFVPPEAAVETACVMGIESSHVKFESIRKLYDYDSEPVRRTRKRIFWQDIRDISDMLSGRVKTN
ncbi:DEKNAAC103586 [Brettanomyces naardenensis]|uniref:ATP-dependent 6-phosphofructokinase n=1 Tax=Brettanomyces naardenensis TaxID=13370 RepID=A0A448YN76_BRENA|nr:DEKNAAC103586 [Brettanomyces naardenensis]